LHKLPDEVSFEGGALVEPFTCGYYAIDANGRTNASETVVVSGGGNIGLCAAAAAHGMGARVILLDPLPLRRAAAEKIGVDVTVDPSTGDAVAKVLELTGGKGADLVIEASPGVWPAAIRFLARTKLDLSPIQTHFFDLTKGVEAFEFGKNPSDCIKVTLTNAV